MFYIVFSIIMVIGTNMLYIPLATTENSLHKLGSWGEPSRKRLKLSLFNSLEPRDSPQHSGNTRRTTDRKIWPDLINCR